MNDIDFDRIYADGIARRQQRIQKQLLRKTEVIEQLLFSDEHEATAKANDVAMIEQGLEGDYGRLATKERETVAARGKKILDECKELIRLAELGNETHLNSDILFEIRTINRTRRLLDSTTEFEELTPIYKEQMKYIQSHTDCDAFAFGGQRLVRKIVDMCVDAEYRVRSIYTINNKEDAWN